MSPAPNRPPLAMKFWLFRRVSGAGSSAGGQSLDRIMSIESVEHIVRNRLRMVMRHTWLVAILCTAAVIGAAWAAFYLSTESEHLRVAAVPADDALKAPVVAILRQNVMALIVPAPASGKKGKKSAKIEKIEQLAGRRVGIVSGNEASPA